MRTKRFARADKISDGECGDNEDQKLLKSLEEVCATSSPYMIQGTSRGATIRRVSIRTHFFMCVSLRIQVVADLRTALFRRTVHSNEETSLLQLSRHSFVFIGYLFARMNLF